MSKNLRHFFAVTDAQAHRRTDTQTKTNHLTTTAEFFFCIYVRGKEGNTTNRTKFLPLHFVKDDLPKHKLNRFE